MKREKELTIPLCPELLQSLRKTLVAQLKTEPGCLLNHHTSVLKVLFCCGFKFGVISLSILLPMDKKQRVKTQIEQ